MGNRVRSGALREGGRGGWTLLEIVVGLAVLAVFWVAAIPPLRNWTVRARLAAAAAEVRSTLHLARSEALRRGNHVALKIYPSEAGEPVRFALVVDGDGDGVANADIDSGVDFLLEQPRPFQHFGAEVRVGFPPGLIPRDPSGSGWLDRLEDPIRFGRSDLVSFSDLGTSTPGTIYLTDGASLFAVRVYNRTGAVRRLDYDPRSLEWKRR